MTLGASLRQKMLSFIALYLASVGLQSPLWLFKIPVPPLGSHERWFKQTSDSEG